MLSAVEHPELMNGYIRAELAAGCTSGPFPRGTFDHLQITQLGVVPKHHTPGKWHLITDLSFPEGWSVNDGVDLELCSLHYTSVDKVA